MLFMCLYNVKIYDAINIYLRKTDDLFLNFMVEPVETL